MTNTRSKRNKNNSLKTAEPTMGSLMDCFNQINEKMSNLISQNNNLEKLLKLSNKKTQLLETKVNHLEHQVIKLQQDKLKNNLVLFGLPKTDKEDLTEIFCNIIKNFDIDVSKENLSKIFRIKQRDTNKNILPTRPEPVVLVLRDFDSKLLILKAFKEQGLLSHQLNIGTNKDPAKVFCKNHLTRENRTLLYQSNELKTIGFKKLWIKNSIVYAQKADEIPVQLTSSHQIEELIHQAKCISSVADSIEDSSGSD